MKIEKKFKKKILIIIVYEKFANKKNEKLLISKSIFIQNVENIKKIL